jgi:hypothetical protein
MPTLRAFYRKLGWEERPGSTDDFAAFDAGTTRLAFYPLRSSVTRRLVVSALWL